MHTSTEKLLHFTKVKANRIAKETMAGPGKFGVFILFCILIVGIHDGFYHTTETKSKECYQSMKFKKIENKENLKEIFPQTSSNLEEKKHKKIVYLNIIKKNQSVKNEESYDNNIMSNWVDLEDEGMEAEILENHIYYDI